MKIIHSLYQGIKCVDIIYVCIFIILQSSTYKFHKKRLINEIVYVNSCTRFARKPPRQYPINIIGSFAHLLAKQAIEYYLNILLFFTTIFFKLCKLFFFIYYILYFYLAYFVNR
jgi:hypothetical protein